MANSILTIDMVTRESLRVLHQELRVIPLIRRDYDDRYARTGAKIGDSLRIRKPAKYVSTVGRALVVQDSQEQFSTLSVANQRHVGMSFSSAEMSLDIDSYSRQFIRPAMAQMAADIESEFLVYVKNNTFASVGSITTNLDGLNTPAFARQILNDQLAPQQNRYVCLNNLAEATIISGTLSTLFNSQPQIKRQYEEGSMGRTVGFDWYNTSLLPVQVNGTATFATGLVMGAGQIGATLIVDGLGASTTIAAGTTFTIAGVNSVHPESKQDLGYLQQFVVTTATTATAGGVGTLSIQPAIVTTGAFQNVTAGPADNAVLVPVGGVSATYGLSLAFHEDSFAFATADLDLPPNVDASRQQMDGVSLRVLRDYDVVNDASILRVDCLYGYVSLYNQLCAKMVNSPTFIP